MSFFPLKYIKKQKNGGDYIRHCNRPILHANSIHTYRYYLLVSLADNLPGNFCYEKCIKSATTTYKKNKRTNNGARNGTKISGCGIF